MRTFPITTPSQRRHPARKTPCTFWFLLLLVVTGCSQNTEEPTSSEHPVAFAADVSTRATETKDITQMGIFAFYTEQNKFTSESTPNFMYNQLATKTGGTWQYTPLKYWPNTPDDYLTFFAYAPYADNCEALEVVSGNGSAGYPQIRYTLPATILGQVDVLTAASPNLTKTSSAVKFTMNHALTRIRFTAKGAHDDTGLLLTQKVTQITLMGGSTTGIASLTPDGVQWTPSADGKEMKCVLTNSEGLNAHTSLSATTPTPLTDTGKGYDLMLIPQDLDNVFLEVIMRITTTAPASYDKSVTFALKDIVDWQPGQTINYQMTLEWNTISELAASITSWGEPVDIPEGSGGEPTIE